MIDENTQQFTKEDRGGTSHLFQISVRAWLAIMLIGMICMTQVAIVVLAILLKDAKLLAIGEPLYTMSGMALAYYFGQQKPQSKTQ